MKQTQRAVIVGLLLLCMLSITATGIAQSSRNSRSSGAINRSLGASQRPAYSPYLNLLRTNSGPVQNYYGLVRPQQQFQATNEQFDANFRSIKRDLEGVRGEADQSTQRTESGHSARFMTDLSSGLGDSMNSRYESSKSSNGQPLSGSRLAPSGHPVTFGNTSSFFPGRAR